MEYISIAICLILLYVIVVLVAKKTITVHRGDISVTIDWPGKEIDLTEEDLNKIIKIIVESEKTKQGRA